MPAGLPVFAAVPMQAGTAALVLAAALALTLVPLAPGEAGEHLQARGIDVACPSAAQERPTQASLSPFPDAEGNVHEAAINCLTHWRVTKGADGRYVPAGRVTRAQMASFLTRTIDRTDHQLPPAGEQPAFADTAGSVHERNINRLARAEIVEGRADGTYGPREPVSRAAMASFLVRSIERVTGEKLTSDDDHDPAFPDTAGSVHEGNIDALATHGVVQGRPEGTYGPREVVRRDAMASFLGRSADYLAEQAHWPLPSTVSLDEPHEDTRPANLVQGVFGRVLDQWTEPVEGSDTTSGSAPFGYELADVRVEVYRHAAEGGPELVHTQRLLSQAAGTLAFTYNAGAAAGDEDVVVACPLSADEDPERDTRWCAAVDDVDGQPTVVVDDDRGGAAVTTSWTDPVAVEAAGGGEQQGPVLAHDPEAGTLDLQTRSEVDGEERRVRLAFHSADSFRIRRPGEEHTDVTVDQFACALQTVLDHDAESYPRLTADYRVEEASLFRLSTPPGSRAVTECS